MSRFPNYDALQFPFVRIGNLYECSPLLISAECSNANGPNRNEVDRALAFLKFTPWRKVYALLALGPWHDAFLEAASGFPNAFPVGKSQTSLRAKAGSLNMGLLEPKKLSAPFARLFHNLHCNTLASVPSPLYWQESIRYLKGSEEDARMPFDMDCLEEEVPLVP